MFKKSLSGLLAVVIVMSVFAALPVSSSAQSIETVESGANLELAETGNPYDRYAKDVNGNWANCTYWAWQYAYDAGYHLPDYSWGHGGMWYANAPKDGYYCDKTPSVNSIMCTGSGTYGHVAYVTDYDSANERVYIKQGGVRGTNDGRDEWWTSASPGDLQGYIHLDGNPVPVPDNPPEKPTNLKIETGKSVIKSTESITFHWDSVATATEYWIYLWKDGTEIYHTCVENHITHTTAPLSVGNYSLAVRAGNIRGYSDTTSISFVVVDSVPNPPANVKTVNGESLFRVDESIEFIWDKVPTADEYWVYMRKDGAEVYNSFVGNNTIHTTASLGAGKYTLLVRAGNSYGYGETTGFSFIIFDTFPEAPKNVRTASGESLFRADENIDFAWDKVSTATEYWVYMWKDGAEVYNSFVGNNDTHTTAPLGAGDYTLLVRAGNSYGYGESLGTHFVVVDTVPAPPSNVRTVTGNTVYKNDDSIEFIWDKVSTATEYWVYMWKDGNEIYNAYTGNDNKHLTAPLSVGNYSLLVRAGNSYGYGESSSLNFSVVNSSTEPQVKYLLGDTDGDNEVTIIDATAIQRHLASLPTRAYNEKAADADEDGKVTILDATAIQRHLASLPTNERIGTLI